jgi:addiction module HigA family antidote
MFELHAAPPSPGEILQEEFLAPLGMTQVQLAERIGVPVQRINTLIHGKRGITPETAILLAGAFGTSAEFWMNLQQSTDLWAARQKHARTKRAPVPRVGNRVLSRVQTAAASKSHGPARVGAHNSLGGASGSSRGAKAAGSKVKVTKRRAEGRARGKRG